MDGARSEPDEHLSLPDAGRTMAFVFVVLSLALMSVGLVLTHLWTPEWDEATTSWFASHRTEGWDRVSTTGTFIANTFAVVAVAAAATTFCVIRHFGRMALLLVVGLMLEVALFLSVNYGVARPRPTATHLGATPSTFSFPSGHVAATVVLYGGMAVLVACRTRGRSGRVLAWSAVGVLVTWVGFSRVYAAQHHPTDALAGLVMGIGALTGALLVLRAPWPPGLAVAGHRVAGMLNPRQPSPQRLASVRPVPEEGTR